MTDAPQRADDPVMAEALDWLLKVHESPDDRHLRSEVAAWLSASEANARAYRKARRVWQLAGDVPAAYRDYWDHGAVDGDTLPVEPPVASAQTVNGTRKTQGAPRRRPGRKWRAGLAVAACAASLAFLSPRLWRLVEADYSTGAGQIRDIALPDGSTVTLGADSALSVDYRVSRRHVVLLRGEAFFKVAHDVGRPFAVVAAGVTMRDIGTTFDVNIQASTLDVAVRSGTVGVSCGSDFAETLTAGERLSIDRTTKRTNRTKEPVDTIAAWRAGKLVVDNVAIDEIVQQLRRYYRGYIWITDAQMSRRRVSGIYDLNDPISALKAAVEPHAGVVTEITPFLVTVSAR